MKELKTKIKELTDNNKKISCTDALSIASDLSINPSEVTKELNIQKIKIKSCQLACFK